MSEWSCVNGFTRPQKKIFYDRSRFRVVVAGRRFGKTVLGVNELLFEAQRGYKRHVWYIAPTYKLAKDLVWDSLKESIPREMILSKHETELSITLQGYESKISLKGADNPDALRGRGLNYVVFDEFADIDQDTWFKVIYPSLTDKRGSALFIGTPKGYNWAYDLSLHAQHSKNWAYHQYTTADGGNVGLDELEYAKSTLSPKQYSQEFLATFESLSNRVYSCFSRKGNVDAGVCDLGGDIHIGMDFNVSPMSAVIASRAGDQLFVWDEISILNGNTEEICNEIQTRYPGRSIVIYPDPSGGSRKTSAPVGQTDFTIIRQSGFDLIAPSSAPPVVDRVNEVNAMMLNARGIKRCFIHPKCKVLIKSLDGLTYKDGTSQPDKKLGLDHHPDALGYMIHMMFPINKPEFTKVKILGI